MLTCQRGTAIATECGTAGKPNPQNPAALVTSPHGPMRERVTGLGNVDDTNWHTQTTLLCAALTVFQHAETAAQIRRLFARSP